MDSAHLKLLGYSPKWLEYGFLTLDLLLAQVQRFQTGDDKNTEHFRYAAFRLLQRRATFSDLEFERYLELAAVDPHPDMGTAALVDLFRHPGLTGAQQELLFEHPLIRAWPRIIKKQRLLKELRRPEISEETLRRCVDEGDSGIHRALLELPELPRSIVEALHERGGNKAVRNIAGIRLKNSDYRAPRR